MKQAILITGSSTGIGRATAVLLHQLDYRVYAGVRRPSDAESLRSAAPGIEPVLLDVAKAEDIRSVAARLAEELPGGLFALINNAGINYNTAFEYASETRSRELMETNYFGLHSLSRHCVPLLRRWAERNPGQTAKLMNVSSIGGYVGLPWEADYHASKFAVLGLTQSLRSELWQQNIRAVAICPGAVQTEILPKTAQGAAEALQALPSDAPNNYAQGLAKFEALARQARRFAVPPEKIAQHIARLLRQKNPKLAHILGLDAKLIHLLSRWLPGSAFDALIRSQFC